MTKVAYNNLNRNIVIKLLFFVFILVYGSFDIYKFSIPLTAVDDIGYWSTAYYYAFGKVKDVASGLSYYAFGYSMLLAFFVKLIKDGVVLYKVILLLNSFLIALSYLFLAQIFECMYSKISRIGIAFFSFVAMMYVSNFSYSKHIFTENFLTFCFLLLILETILIVEKYSFFRLCIAIGICVFMHFVHQRTIAVLLAYAFFLIFFFVKKRLPIRHMLIAFAIAVLLFWLGSIEKQRVIDCVYVANELITVNDYSSNVSKVANIFSKDSLFYFVLSVCGKLGYFIFSTFMLNAVGLWAYLKNVYKYTILKEDSESKRGLIGLFIVLATIFVIAVASVFMYGPLYGRFEVAMYGRYMEYIFPILIVNGLIYLYENSKEQNIVITIIWMFLVLCLCGIEYQFINEKTEYSGAWLIPGTYLLFNKNISLVNSLKIMGKISVGVVLLLYVASMYKKNSCKKKLYFIMLCVGAMLYWNACYSGIKKDYLKEQEKFYSNCKDISILIKESDGTIYYDVEDNNALRFVRQLQFENPSYDFVKWNNDIHEKQDNDLLIYQRTKMDNETDYNIVFANNIFICVQ